MTLLAHWDFLDPLFQNLTLAKCGMSGMSGMKVALVMGFGCTVLWICYLVRFKFSDEVIVFAYLQGMSTRYVCTPHNEITRLLQMLLSCRVGEVAVARSLIGNVYLNSLNTEVLSIMMSTYLGKQLDQG